MEDTLPNEAKDYVMQDVRKISIQEALEMFADIFDEDQENIQLGTNKEELEGWDSLGMLSLMAELDSRFNITLNAGDLGKLSGINDLVNMLKDNDVIADE